MATTTTLAARVGCSILVPATRRGLSRRTRLPQLNSSSSSSSFSSFRACHSSLVVDAAASVRAPAFLPLFERLASHTVTVADLERFREQARGLASSVGPAYLHADGGPTSQELLRELEWLLEDAVADPHWEHVRQRQDHHRSVRLRVSITHMEALWRQRVEARRPFQYVVGCAHWRDLVLCVKEGVLIPRPETELIIDLAEVAMKEEPRLTEGTWVDLGTGSGALAIALARLPCFQGSVIAVDASDEAVAISCLNVRRYGLEDRVKVVHGSWFSPFENKDCNICGVLSNPPYIPSNEIPHLQAEVGKHEPRLALDGGQDGTNDLREICVGSARILQAGGFLALETNGGKQAEIISELLSNMEGSSFEKVVVVKDFAGISRFVTSIHR